MHSLILESNLAPVFDVFGSIFWYVIVIIFGPILDQFWKPKWTQNRWKIDSKFDQIFSRILEWFLDRFWSIEHAARNTAAAPFSRRSSLEWPYKIWILLLSIGHLCCIFGVFWEVLVTILGALGVHFGSQNGSFWVPGVPLAPWKTQSSKSPEKELKKEAPGHIRTSI